MQGVTKKGQRVTRTNYELFYHDQSDGKRG